MIQVKQMESLVLYFFLQLIALLREVKYLQQRELPDQPIPESACSVYAQHEVYRKYIQNLDVVVSLYNKWVINII